MGTNMNREEKRQLQRRLEVFLASDAPRLSIRQSLFNPFALFGGAVSVLLLLVVWSGLTWPWRRKKPQQLELDALKRSLGVRPRPGGKLERLPYGAVRELEVTFNPGGLLGNFAEWIATHSSKSPDSDSVPPSLHLALHLRDGRRLVVLNQVNLEAAEVEAFAKQVGQLLGVPVRTTSGAPRAG
jgi:hypothetical protein